MKKSALLLLAVLSAGCAIRDYVRDLERNRVICEAHPLDCPFCPNGWRYYPDAGGVCRPVRAATPTPTQTPAATSSPEPTATNSPAPAASPTPTMTPTPGPTVAPDPERDPWCVDLSEVPAGPEPIFTGITAQCRRGRGYVEVVAPDGARGCWRNWRCEDGNQDHQPAPKAQYSLTNGGPGGVHRCAIGEGGGPAYVCDAGRRYSDGWHRQVKEDGTIHQPGPEPNGYIPKPWESNGACRPVICPPKPTPTPTARPGGPTPTPGTFPPQPDDFAIKFVNTCQVLHYVKDLGNGQCRGECDGTHRYIGTLRSTGEKYGNTCDRDHWQCAVDLDCTDRENWQHELAEHRKTCELCGCREWTTTAGVELHVEGLSPCEPGQRENCFEKDDGNPYKHTVYADCGATLQIYGCVPDGARTLDGLPIPGGKGCGPAKSVRFEGR